MKKRFPICGLSKILSTLFCLICLNQSGICQNGTKTSEAFSSGFDLAAHLPEIVRDLKVCDLIKIERDTQAAYITSLTGQLNTAINRLGKVEAVAAKFKLKSKRRGGALAAVVAVVIVKTAIKIVSR